MANTTQSLLAKITALNVANIYNPSGLDLLQVVGPGHGVIWNIDKNGVAHNNPVTSTKDALFGRHFGASVAKAFANLDAEDIMHVVSPNGQGIQFHVDSTGTPHTP